AATPLSPRSLHDALPISTREEDIQALLDKQAAGANFAITQVFYDAPSYLDLVAEARAAGVSIPIVPGIIPTTDPARLVRVAELTGVPVPPELLAALDTADAATRHATGVRRTAQLVEAVLAGGAPGVHLYAFTRHEAALDVLDAAGLLPTTTKELL